MVIEINGLQKFSHKTVKMFKQQYNTNQMSWKALFKSILLFSLCDFVFILFKFEHFEYHLSLRPFILVTTGVVLKGELNIIVIWNRSNPWFK